MSISPALIELATAYGIAPSYTGNDGQLATASGETLSALLEAIGVDISDPVAALERKKRIDASRPLPPTVVSPTGREQSFNIHVHDGAPAEVTIELEDGTTRPTYQDDNFATPVKVDDITWGEATFHIPGDLPLGYHRLHLVSDGIDETCSLIITPSYLTTTDRYLDDHRFGVMAQLYSARSEGSWSVGDFADLGDLAATLAETIDADFLLVNPLHAAQPAPPIEDSPYLPASRRFTNPLYLRVEDTPEYAQATADVRENIEALAAPLKELNRSAQTLNRTPVYAAKLTALASLYDGDFSDERADAFQAFKESEGQGLIDFAQWCEDQAPEHPADFYAWLQFLCDEQLADAQKKALDAGMSIGIITDLAVGVHPGGADAATMADWMAPEASVGAPPDGYNQQGQDWSQPPWNPAALAQAGYAPWRDMLRTVLRHSGGLRVDHILGLFRLFWMPRLQPPTTGTYVTYDFEAMLGILALEAERADAVVVGEDLGTFEPWVQEVLAGRGVLGTSVLWFENDGDDNPAAPQDYRRLAMSSIGTHDLPPTAGYLAGEHIKLRERLGLLSTDPAQEEIEDLAWQARVLDKVAEEGCFEETSISTTHFEGLSRAERGDIDDLLVGLHRYIARTNSALTCTNLVDLVGDMQVQNQPGTNSLQYSNWCIPLCDGNGQAVLIEDLAGMELVRRVGDASARAK